MWNFSNGQMLTDLQMGDLIGNGQSVTEITAVTCAFDPDLEAEKTAHIIAVGWNKNIFIWADEKDEVVDCSKVLPRNE